MRRCSALFDIVVLAERIAAVNLTGVDYCRLIELRREVGIWASVVVADQARNAGGFAGL